MATVQEPRSRPKYDQILDARLSRALHQVRTADLTVAFLGLFAITLGFGLAMLLLDRWLDLPAIVRQFALVGYLVVAGIYVFKILRPPFVATINPYYAARQVERTLPEAKNSLVSWLDLRDEPLAPSIHDAVGRRAASDLDRADLDEAVRDTRLSRYGSVVGLLAVALIILLCLFRPTQFFSLLARTFAPFTTTAIAQRTRIEILEPKGGDITIPINYSVDVRVDVDGRIPRADEPDALRLKYRYSEDDQAWEEKRLEPTDRSGEWGVRVPAAQVRNGFEYQVTGGDAATPVYRVRVRAKALVTDFEVRYHYRPYLHFNDDVRADPNLQAVRGTEVTLVAKSNRPVREGTLRFQPTAADGKELTISGEKPPDKPDSLQYSFVMQQDGHYRLHFVAADGEPSDESLPFEVRVLPDNPPNVDITHPAPEKLPVNGTLTLSGNVTDDFGLTKARLTMALKANVDAPPVNLPPVVHNSGKPLPMVEGREPRALSVKEVVALDQLKDVAGNKIDLRPAMVITYRYEAEDNCDYPKPQLGLSKEFTVTLIEPQDQAKRDAEREEANQEKKEHDEKQQNDGNGGQPGDNNEQPKDGEQRNDQPMNPGDQQTIDQAKRIADELNKDNQSKPDNDQGQQSQANKDGAKQDGKDQKSQPDSNHQTKPNDGAGDKNQSKPDNTQGQQSQPNKDGAKQDGKDQKPQPDGDYQTKPNDGAGDKNQAKSHDSKEKGGDNKNGDAKAEKSKAGESNPNKPDNRAGDKQQRSDQKDQQGDKKQDEMNQPAGNQRDENNKPSGDQKQQRDKQTQPGKTSDTPEKKKPDEKTEKSGEKPGMGAKEDKPNDTQPKTSPEKGNADKGQQGSQRAGEGQKNGDKNEKPKDAAISGKADPNAGKPEGDKPQGANDQNDKKANPGDPTKPESSGANKPMGKDDKTKAQEIKDANKPHEKSGDKPTLEPKTKGSDGKPQSGNEQAKEKADKPDANAKAQAGDAEAKDGENKTPPRPPEIQKQVDNFKKSDERNRELQLKGLENQAKAEKNSERKKAIEEAIKECKECNSPSGTGNKPKPSEKTGGEGKSSKPGEGKDGNNDKKQEGDKPTPDGKMQPKNGAGEPKAKDVPNRESEPNGQKKPDPNGNPADQGKTKEGEPGKEKPQDSKSTEGPGTATGKREGEADMPADTNKGSAPNEKFLRESGELQLENFKKKVDSKVLEQLKITDEEYQAFLRSYENLVKRSKEMPKPGPDDRARGVTKGGSSANSGAKRADNSGKNGPQTNRGGRGPVPPEFRDQYKEFTEEQAKQEKPKDK